ncbi:MAG TPA: DUF6279 family lipoprotein [Hydrogenophaga sp.]
MHTFPAATPGPVVQSDATQSRGARTIIARTLRRVMGAATVLTTALVVTGCSTLKLAYHQAPHLAYFWFNDHLDLQAAQATPFKQDLERFFQWHQTEELPRYVAQLQQWQTLARQDITAEQACTQFDLIRQAYLRGTERALAPLAQLTLTLQAPQFKALSSKHQRSNQKFEEEWLSGSEADKLARRVDKAVDRYEDLYGRLSKPQRTLLTELTQRSGLDPKRWQAERQRRHEDLMASLRQAQAQPDQAHRLLQAWHARVMQSPDAAYATYQAARIDEGCQQFALLHNATSPAQREHAVKTLQRYENDFASLIPSL